MTADLRGVRILDFSPTIGVLATSALADLGADVVHVGRPGGGGTLEPVGRGKRSIALNLKSAGGREIALDLARTADVVVEGYRPGVADRLGIGYAALSAEHPTLVYCSLSGYGQNGPYASWAGHDLNYQGVSGHVQFGTDGRPEMPSGPWADRAAGFNLQIAILAGLLARHLHGVGQWIDVAMVASTITIPLAEQYAVPGVGRMPTGAMSGSSLPRTPMIDGQYCWYGMYECADGEWLSIACLEPQFWRRLCERFGRRDWEPDQFAPGVRQEELRRELAAAFHTRSRPEWLAELAVDVDLPVAPVLRPEELTRDPHLAYTGAVVHTVLPGGQRMLQAASPLRSASLPRETSQPAMVVSGMHTREILSELGRTVTQIDELLSTGAAQENAFPKSMRTDGCESA
jgi:crotonobetainyl-CoA:carnitine CoA-transferase CaiB-like acyl-CoA transferase